MPLNKDHSHLQLCWAQWSLCRTEHVAHLPDGWKWQKILSVPLTGNTWGSAPRGLQLCWLLWFVRGREWKIPSWWLLPFPREGRALARLLRASPWVAVTSVTPLGSSAFGGLSKGTSARKRQKLEPERCKKVCLLSNLLLCGGYLF